jgi:hypothetical protein
VCVCVCVFCQGQAANTANRRVLVTDKNGKQSVQTINDELGMNGKDMGEVKRRLGKQGVDMSNVEMYGSGDNRMDKPTSFRRGANLPGTGTHRVITRIRVSHVVQCCTVPFKG